MKQLDTIPKKQRHYYGYLSALILLFIIAGLWWALTAFSHWNSKYEIVPQRLIQITAHLPFKVEERKTPKEASPTATPPKLETANEKVIRLVNEKFGADAPATLVLLQGESGIRDANGNWVYRYWAVNQTSGACGLFQALPCEKMPCELTWQDIECQVNWGYDYIKGRYGNSTNAHNFWLAQVPSHWY